MFAVEAQCTTVLDAEWVECDTDTSLQKLNAYNWQARSTKLYRNPYSTWWGLYSTMAIMLHLVCRAHTTENMKGDVPLSCRPL